jgi:site-specific recombinase XerC
MGPAPPPRSDDGELLYPDWFSAFMADRAVRKPSPHTAKAYGQDFAAIAILLAGDSHRVADLTPTDITRDALQAAFAAYADAHEAASIRRCWSTWNTLCGFLYTGEFIGANPMPLIGRPKVAKSLPRASEKARWLTCFERSTPPMRHLVAPTGPSATAP